MKKHLQIISLLIMISSLKLSAQWSQVGFMIVNLTDTAKGSYVIRGFGNDLFSGTAKGLFKSTDNGNSWTNISFNAAIILNQEIYSVLKASNGHIFAGSNKRMFKSVDGGITWTWLNILPDSATYYDVSEIGGNIVVSYLKSATKGVYYSNNFGTSWNASTGITSNVRYFLVDATNLFLGGTSNGVYKSIDNGQTWVISGTGFPVSAGIWGVLRSGTKLLAHSINGNGLFESIDNGLTWVNSSPTIFNGFCQVFSFSSIGNNIILTNDGACNLGSLSSIRISNDNGNTWNNFLNGTTPPNYFPIIGKNGANTSFFTQRGNGKEVYRYDLSATGTKVVNKEEVNISISPNPAFGIFYFKDNNTTKSEIEIYNIVGEIIYKTTTENQQTTIDISKHPKGIYTVKIVGNDKSTTNKKIILQ